MLPSRTKYGRSRRLIVSCISGSAPWISSRSRLHVARCQSGRPAMYASTRGSRRSFVPGGIAPSLYRIGSAIESEGALDDLAADASRERGLGAHLDKASSSEHLRRPAVVTGDATEQWPGRLDRKERLERTRCESLSPARRRDPVRDIPFAVHREAADRPDELPVILDRQQRVLGVAAHTLVVGFERAAIGRIRARERRHLDGTRIALPGEERVEVAVCKSSQADRHQRGPSIVSRRIRRA